MPELPELEVLRRSIEQTLVGRTIVDVTVNREECVNIPPEEYVAAVSGAKIIGARRFGKTGIVDLDNGYSLIVHLALGGLFVLADPQEFEEKHIQIAYHLDDGSTLLAAKLMLGNVHARPTAEVGGDSRIAKMGPDALDELPSVERLAERFRTSRTGAKAFLMDQSRIGGIGNMYANEILFEARVHPATQLRALSADDIARLHGAIEGVLEQAIAGGGAADTVFADLDGRETTYQEKLRVFGREGEPCPECACKVRMIRLATRATYYCPKCQKKKYPRKRATRKQTRAGTKRRG
ncbi:MAG: bifunctional DNA-formamidopyrimidine glycosylase/DNA-(apurinic or apyrimidinic site) lyase [Armatimonadota bacterium]|jgi:formamidopyrimidine-DNA glycosylase